MQVDALTLPRPPPCRSASRAPADAAPIAPSDVWPPRLRAGDARRARRPPTQAYGARDLRPPGPHARRPRRRRGRPAAGLHRGLAARGRLRPAPGRPADVGADHRAQPRDRPPAPACPRAARPAAARRPHGRRPMPTRCSSAGASPSCSAACPRTSTRCCACASTTSSARARSAPPPASRIGTVKARMVRGLTRLREMIEAEGA